MAASDRLTVCRGQESVGRLWLDSNHQFTFQYSDHWLKKANALPLSLAQSLQVSPIDADKLKPFFVNLLPEDEVKQTIAATLNLTADSDFELLEALAGDCVGNLTLFTPDHLPSDENHYRAISDDELFDQLSHYEDRPLLVGEKGVRLSISGSREQLPIYIDKSTTYIPMDGAPSSHLLKIGHTSMPGLIENEAFCTELAELIGLTVVKGEFRAGKLNQYVVARSDRSRANDGRIVRLHQEDFCQLMNIAPQLKYEKEGGPSLKDCFGLVRRYSINPLVDTNQLLKWVIFNYLIGNHDAHAKSLAFVVADLGPRLAPFTDVICSCVYQGVSQPLAMKIGGEDRSSWIIAKRWDNFAKDVNIKSKYVRLTLETMAKQILGVAQRLAKDFLKNSKDSESVIPTIVSIIKTRSKNALTNLRATQ